MKKLIVLMALVVCSPAVAQKETGTMPKDRQFVMKAASTDMAEIKLAKLAMEKGTSPDVKQFAQRMIADHTKTSNELKTIAKKQNISLPTDVTPEQKMTYDRLSRLTGPEFDRAYMEVMAKDHGEAVTEFTKQATEGSDPELKQFASKTLPTLKEHDSMAHEGHKAPAGGTPKK
jgi:putative membrane protein